MPIRVVLQGISQASLLVDNEERYIHCGRGIIIYVSFIRNDNAGAGADDHSGGLTDDDVAAAVQTILETKIFTHFSPEKMAAHAQSLAECPLMDIMIVPQASLGGKINKKGHTVQFHHLVGKDIGAALYARFCHHVRVARGVNEETVDVNGVPLSSEQDGISVTEGHKDRDQWLKYSGRVLSGTFGNRQGLLIDSDGPFTHFFDL